MLQKLNERIQGVVAWLVIILIALTFTLFGVDYYIQSHHTADAKVFVNGAPLSNRSFENYYRRVRSQQDIAQFTAAEDKKIQDQILNQMVANEVTLQSARRYGFEVSSEQANAAILRIPQFQEDGHFSAQKYQQALSSASFTAETFQSEVRQGVLLNQQRFAFIGSSFALPEEINRFVRLYLQTRDYEYLIIPYSHYINQASVSEEEMKKYYDAHRDDFQSPEQVSIEYVALSSNDIRKKLTISDDEVKRYYDENRTNFLTPAQWKVAHILFAIPESSTAEEEKQIQQKAESVAESLKANPEQFNQLLQQFSDDKLSLADKGELPWLVAGQSEYDRILSQLDQPGQISKVQKTKLGYEIFKLVDYKPAVTKPYKDVSNIIKEQFISEQAQAQYAHALEQLSDLSYQNPDSLTPVSDALGIPVLTTKFFSRNGGETDLAKNPLIINAAFSQDVLEMGNNSEPVQLDNDTVVVLRVKKHLKATIRSFDEVKSQVGSIMAKQLAMQKAAQIGTRLLNPIEDKEQQKLIEANKLKWQLVTNSSRDNGKEGAMVNDLAFNVLRPGSREGAALENGDYVVVKLTKINDGNLSNLDLEQRNSLVQQIEASYGVMDYDLYVKSLINKAVIEKA